MVKHNFRPRIVESECIEKIPVTVNKKIILNDLNTSKNNMDNGIEDCKHSSKYNSSRINRNKNVDLAFGMKITKLNKTSFEKDLEINSIKAKYINEVICENQIQDTNQENAKISINENPYGKHYVLNDNRVFEKSKFEIEFEEFEIYDPIKK